MSRLSHEHPDDYEQRIEDVLDRADDDRKYTRASVRAETVTPGNGDDNEKEKEQT